MKQPSIIRPNESAHEATVRLRGARMKLNREVFRGGIRLLPGRVITIDAVTNAGFRGMEVSGRTGNKTFVWGIEPTYLTPVR